MKRFLNWNIHAIEVVLAALFLWGSYGAFTSDEPVITDIDFIKPLVGHDAVIIYGILFASLGIGLLAGKLFNWRKVHGLSLMGMYLTVIYVIILKLLLEGFTYDILTNVAICLITAALYLRWKYNILTFQRPNRKVVVDDLLNE